MSTLTMDPQTLVTSIGRHVDWARPELASLAAGYAEDDPQPALVGLVQHLRTRSTPMLGYTPAFVAQLRTAVGEAGRIQARERIAAAFSQDLLMPYHHNAFMALGAETLLVGLEAESSRRLAAHVWEQRARWRDGYWGVAGSVGHLLRYLWPLEEVADLDLLPLFGWLLEKTTVEWADARAWTEPMLGTTGHNWWAHTFMGFWCAGFAFPEFTMLAPFRAFVPEYLERELTLLFDDDGWSKEGSPGYHEFAMANLLEGAVLAAQNGLAVPAAIWARLRQIANTGWQLLAPDGDYPVFGDAVRRARYAGFGTQQREDRGSLSLVRRRAARFGLSEAKYVAEALEPEWRSRAGEMLPETGEDLLPAYHRLSACPPADLDTRLSHSGLYVLRQNWTPQADWVGIEAGPLGTLITSHKHASLFNFELYARGRRLLVDNWYGSVAEERADDRVRMWRVSTAAHNTATIDGQDQVPILGEFRYGAVVTPTVDDWRSTPAFAYFSGVHEGYRHLPEPVAAHRRKLFYLRGRYWILLDRFSPTTSAEHTYQLHFHLNAPSTLSPDGRVLTQGAGGNLLILPVPGLDGTPTLAPNPYPIDGYENPAHLTYTRRTAGNMLFATLLVPFTDDAVPAVTAAVAPVQADGRTLDPWEVTGLVLTIDGRQEYYLDHHLQWNLPWQLSEHTGTARLFHSACPT
jgi:hypothetical protein